MLSLLLAALLPAGPTSAPLLSPPAPVTPLVAQEEEDEEGEGGGVWDPDGLQLDYGFTLEDPAKPVVRCQLLLARIPHPLTLALPERAAFVRLDAPRLVGEVTGRATIGKPIGLERTGPYTWRLDPRGESEVLLEWSVPLDQRAQPAVQAARDQYEWPYVADDHALLTTATLAIAPVDTEVGGIRVRFFPPSGWPVEVPWKTLRPRFFAPPSVGALQDELVLLGRWKLELVPLEPAADRDAEGAGARDEDAPVHAGVAGAEAGGEGEPELLVAYAPGQEHLRPLVEARIPAIVSSELALFGDRPIERYLFVFGRPDGGQGFGGSPRAHSMTLFVQDGLPAEVVQGGLAHLVAHEFFHVWQRARCRPADELHFVTEGFTDWFAYRTALRLGFLSSEAFEDTFARNLADCETARAALPMPFPEAGGPAFFEGGDAYRATYSGGFVLAAALELALAREDPPATLEAVLRRLWNDPRWTSPEPGREAEQEAEREREHEQGLGRGHEEEHGELDRDRDRDRDHDGMDADEDEDAHGEHAERPAGPDLDDFLAAVEAVGGDRARALVATQLAAKGAPDLLALFASLGLELERDAPTVSSPLRYHVPPGTAERFRASRD